MHKKVYITTSTKLVLPAQGQHIGSAISTSTTQGQCYEQKDNTKAVQSAQGQHRYLRRDTASNNSHPGRHSNGTAAAMPAIAVYNNTAGAPSIITTGIVAPHQLP